VHLQPGAKQPVCKARIHNATIWNRLGREAKMDHPVYQDMQRLPKETLIELIKMYSRNWLTVDGLWFTGVEQKYGLDAAVELDVRMWKIGSRIKAKRIKNLLNLGSGLENIIKAINFMKGDL
jgi:hypothetical protein